MRKTKKILSLLLAVLMIITSCVCVASAAKDYDVERTNLPTVYLQGQGATIFKDRKRVYADRLYEFDIPDGYIGDYGKKLIGPLMKGLATNKWGEWEDIFVEAITNFTGKIALDNNGNVKDDSCSFNSMSPIGKKSDGKYSYKASKDVYQYGFCYDWRLDPCEIADQVDAYIDRVLAKTGETKVNMVARCLGANVALAYLEKYGSDKLDKVLLAGYGFDGFATIDAIYCGEIELDADAATRLVNDYVATGGSEGDPMFDFLADFAYVTNELKALGIPAATINRVYKKVRATTVPRLMLDGYGTFPSFWGLLSDEGFDKAKSFLLGGKEEEYAGLIEKIDYFHTHVFEKSKEIIQETIDNGVPVYVVTKYGLQNLPIVKDDSLMADQLLETASGSAGATCSKVDGTLSKNYIKAAQENGTEKYISPDNQIDSSTCFLPEQTWFVKNVGHMDTPLALDDMYAQILNSDKFLSVFDDENLPQYVQFNVDDGTIVPVPEAGKKESKFVAFFKRYFSQFKTFFRMLKNLLG